METKYNASLPKGIQCQLCPHLCKLFEGEWGKCRARQNVNDKVIAQNYARVAALALDPIEKKPLFHFYPGTQILSAGTFGCNFKCDFCQNWQLAHGGEKGEYVSAEKLLEVAQKTKEDHNIGLAYTYSEPLMWYEYVKEAAVLAKEAGLQNVLVTNGFINPKPLDELLPYIDAANIDVKSFSKEFYDEVIGGDIKVVLNNVLRFKKAGVHVELTYLLITALNDSYQEAKAMVKWIKEEIGSDTPLHISRYFPNYKMELPPTPVESLQRCYEAAKEELTYVYLGNLHSETGQNTVCPKCNTTVIERKAYVAYITALDKGKCEVCGFKISGRYS